VKRYHSIGELPLGGPRRVVAIGTFDGVHLGHRAIIGRAIALAKERGRTSMVVTFHPSPIKVLRPEIRTSTLTGVALKSALIEQLGVDELLVIPFNQSFSRVRAERFVELLSSAPIGADAIVVGDGFRFGHGGTGTVSLMREVGRSVGLVVEGADLISSEDEKPISSTRIRRLIAQGHVEEARTLLDRPHVVEGTVVAGDHRGRQIGIPTANVAVDPPDAAVPGRGVYAGFALLPHGRESAAINVGVVPTFVEASGGPERPTMRVEAHLIDYDGPDVYGQQIRVEFIARIRDERRFESAEALVAQIGDDLRLVREILARERATPPRSSSSD
jgi:riboflavin kinase/FMN adenylyltransferase